MLPANQHVQFRFLQTIASVKRVANLAVSSDTSTKSRIDHLKPSRWRTRLPRYTTKGLADIG